mgnify:CR=1 FL=1
MKLVYRIVLHLAWVLSLLLAAWAVLFYFALTDRIDRETDDSLEARAETAIKQFLSGRALPDSGSGNDGCLLRSIPDEYAAVRPQEVYTDERIYIPERDAREPARVLRMLFRDGGGRWHELTVMAPAIEKNELTRALLRWVVSLYLVLLLLLLVVSAWVLHRTMRPLYALLRWLDDYTVGKPNPPLADDTAVAEFRRLNDAARRYAARAESLFERQKQFITDAGHELKTPITVIGTSLKVLEMEVGKQKWIDKAMAQTEKLTSLVNSLVTLSRMDEEDSPLRMEDFPVSDAVRETAETFVDFAASKGHELRLSITDGLTYRGDEYAVRQLVSILLDNAVKYALPDSPIEFSLEKAKRGVVLRSSNACEDVAPENAQKLFDRFYRADQSRSSGSGFGIGLSIARSIAEGHHGSIRARVDDGKIEFTAELK